MKKTYMHPTINVVMIQTQHQMLAGSEVGIGQEYNGETVLGRGDSDWEYDD